jgi:crotonobetainyl-CoA:carnitine CoA-transferase CaiB-like acyl-CoA transferase
VDCNNERMLNGIKVVDMSSMIAGPAAAKVLGEWGAEVIKVESPQPDTLRTLGLLMGCPISDDENPHYDQENIFKRSICLNLKTLEGREILDKLLVDADVLITNYRQDALVGLGLSYAQTKEKYPGLVYGHILGYGDNGPDALRPGYDQTAFMARSGLMTELGEPDCSPLNPAAGFADRQVGMYLAAGICAALIRKMRTGIGEKVNASLLHGAIFALGSLYIMTQYGKIKYPATRKKPVTPITNCYQTRDKRWVVICLPALEQQWPVFCKAIGRNDLCAAGKYTTAMDLVKNSAEIRAILDEVFIQKDVEEWLRIFKEADLTIEKVQNFDEVVADEQVLANQYLREVSYPSRKVKMPTTPVQFIDSGLRAIPRAAKKGEHTTEILLELGYSPNTVEAMRNNRIIK